jgi:hydrogenase maturation protein HypF
MHPDYISARTAKKFASLPVLRVQHHHAHIASCMAEHGLDEKVIGVSFDGTGYGADGNIWGSEFMVCDLSDFRRISHFEYIPLPGGDSAIEEPWRIGVSWLYKVYGKDFMEMDLPLVEQAGRENIDIIIRMIERNINCPLTSGAGRLFDAVASMTGLVQTASFQAEGPMRLESLVIEGLSESYPFENGSVIGLGSTIKAITADILAKRPLMTIATKLHNTIILTIFDTVRKIRSEEGINKVALSGGVFQNKYLLSGAADQLEKDNFEVFTHASVPPNDGGIALGQLAVASKRRELKCV